MNRAALVVALLAVAPAGARADAALADDFSRRVFAAARPLSCAAEVWSPALSLRAAGWSVAPGYDPAPALPAPGDWASLQVPLGTADGRTATVPAKVRLRREIPAWRLQVPTPQGGPLGSAVAVRDLVDPRLATGPLWTGPLPPQAVATRGLPEGALLLASDVSASGELPAGRHVELHLRDGAIQADDAGVLLETGADGATVRVQHLRSGRVVVGTFHDGAVWIGD